MSNLKHSTHTMHNTAHRTLYTPMSTEMMCSLVPRPTLFSVLLFVLRMIHRSWRAEKKTGIVYKHSSHELIQNWLCPPPPNIRLASTWCHSRDECSQAFPIFHCSSTSVCYCQWKLKSESGVGLGMRLMMVCVCAHTIIWHWQWSSCPAVWCSAVWTLSSLPVHGTADFLEQGSLSRYSTAIDHVLVICRGETFILAISRDG